MAEHIWRIYRYYNPIEDKSYIGQTAKNVNDRAGNGKGYRKGTKFREAVDKYGWDTFEQSILRLCTSQEDANYWERYFIDKYNSIENGYNSQEGGVRYSMLDRHLSDETRQRLSESRKGKYLGENSPCYGKRGELNPNYGKKHPEHSERMKGENNPMYGKTWYNNGTINIYININTTEVPEGFMKGRLYKRKEK